MAITRTLFEGTTQPATGTSVSTGSIALEPGDALVAFASFTDPGGTQFSATLSDDGVSTPAWSNVESSTADVLIQTSGTMLATAAESCVVTATIGASVNTPRLVVVRLRGSPGSMVYASRIVVAQPNAGSTGIISAGSVSTTALQFAIAGLRNDASWIAATPTGSMTAITESTDFVQFFERNGSGSGTESFDNGIGGGRMNLAVYLLTEVIAGYVHTRPANPSRMGVDRIARGIH